MNKAADMRIDELQSVIDKMANDAMHQQAEAVKYVQGYADRVKEYHEIIVARETALIDCNKDRDALREEIKIKTNKLGELSAKNEYLTTKLTGVTDEIAQMKSLNHDLIRKTDEQRDRLMKADAAVADAQNKAQLAEQSRETLKVRLGNFQEKYDKLRSEVAAGKRRIEDDPRRGSS